MSNGHFYFSVCPLVEWTFERPITDKYNSTYTMKNTIKNTFTLLLSLLLSLLLYIQALFLIVIGEQARTIRSIWYSSCAHAISGQ